MLVAVSLSVTTLLHAQEQVTPKKAGNIESTIPPAGPGPVLAPDSKPEIKLMEEPQNAAKTDTNNETVPANNITPKSTLAPDDRANAVRRVPIIPVQNTTSTAPAAKPAADKPAVIQQQQQQNQD
jgi:hypothetical protein